MLIEPNLNRPEMLRRNTMYDEQAKKRYYKEKLDRQDDVAKKLQLAKNMRLAHPRGFACNTTICGALFFQIKIHVTAVSVQNLLALSNHPIISQFVRRVVFVQPQFQSEMSNDYEGYISEIIDTIDEEVERIVEATVRRNRRHETVQAFTRRARHSPRNQNSSNDSHMRAIPVWVSGLSNALCQTGRTASRIIRRLGRDYVVKIA